MKCKLCREEKSLKQSHIIPEFLYSKLYDEKHRFHEIHVDSNRKNKLPQKGVREPLLCGLCEEYFSKFERYASLVLNGGFELIAKKIDGLFYFEGVEYNKFKLFSLSILWRASISSLDFFAEVNLGGHEEIIRKILLSGDAGNEGDYPFILSPILHENEIQEALIVKPTLSAVDQNDAYRFVFGGIVWVFVISNNEVPDVVVQASISKSGVLKMLPWQMSEIGFLVGMAEDAVRNGKL
ncbi:hypothetical protein [Paraglaciecola hydrolytica]|uniref:HNH endonuclease 5 domain-containing protein n=1 Tax=Paraglaciecola hydrolytica TaxID=1799789 RepID=A0A135ZYR6_9ALTE|nr:hypothetical protein [Paraglaciecola hydrolytica]KXI28121.1 hypothetical protein AX660_17195 [Paraglaciecola hydrolytica]